MGRRVSSRRRWIAAAVGSSVLLLPPAPAGAAGDGAGPDAAGARGRIVYREGRSPSGGTIRAAVGGTMLPGEAVPCIGCHGSDGRGRPEGGVAPPEITWEALAKPYGHVHPGGRKHPAFDERTAARAVTEGIDPAGNPLAPAMPRYSMSASDLRDLVAYLGRLDDELPPGVTAEAIRVATVLPSRGPLAELGADLLQLLRAEVAELDRGGGIHGRRLELVVAYHDGRPGAGAEELAALHGREPVFAVIGGVVPGAEEALAAVVAREELPWIGPLTHLELAGGGGWVFRPTAGLSEEARLLVRHVAAGGLGPGGSGVVLHPGEPGYAAAARAAAEEARRADLALEVRDYARDSFDPGVAAELKDKDVDWVVFLGGDEELAAFAARGEALGFAPHLLVPGTGAVRAAAASPGASRGRVRFAFSALPGGENPGAVEAVARASPAFRSGRHRAALSAVHAATAVLAEGLRCAGRKIDRRRMVACLERINGLEVGLAPPVRFGPGRRSGASGGYIVTFDPEAQTFRRVGGFLRL